MNRYLLAFLLIHAFSVKPFAFGVEQTLSAPHPTVPVEPLAWVDVLPDRLVMVVDSTGYVEVPLPTNVVRRRDDGDCVLTLPLPARNFLSLEMTGGETDGAAGAPGHRWTVEATMPWTNAASVVHTFNGRSRPSRFGLLFSAYARSVDGAVVKADLTLDWRGVKSSTNVVSATAQAAVGREWKRILVRLPFDEYALNGTAHLQVGGHERIEVAGLQLEPWGDAPITLESPANWTPGGTVRSVRAPSLLAGVIPTDWQQGSVTLNVRVTERPQEGPIDGERNILSVGGGQAILDLSVDSAWVNKTKLPLPTLREILADGAEHTLLLTWNSAEVCLYADGKRIGSAPVKQQSIPLKGQSVGLFIGMHYWWMRNLGGEVRSLRFYDRPVTPEETTFAVTDRGPWLEPPLRRVFRRDEEDAEVVLPLHGEGAKDVVVRLRGLPVSDAKVVRQGGQSSVRIRLKPWQHSAGASLDGTIILTPKDGVEKRWNWPVRIVPALERDRFMVGNWWSPGNVADLEWARDLGLGLIDSRNDNADYLNRVAEYGLRASINFASLHQDPHPATPEHLARTRTESVRMARAIASFPWVVSCVLNSEGIGRDDIDRSPAALALLKQDLGMEAPLIPPRETWMDLGLRPKVDLSAFVTNGIVPDDYPPLRYVHWMQRKGDGMNLASAVTAEEVRGRAPWVRLIQEPARVQYASWADTVANWRYANTPRPILTVWLQGLAAARAAGKSYYPITGHCYYGPEIRLDDEAKTVVRPSGDMASAFLWTGMLMPIREIRCFAWWQKDWADGEKVRPGTHDRIKAAIAEVSRMGTVMGDVPLHPAPLAVLIPEANRFGRGNDEWWHAYGSLVYEPAHFFIDHDLPVDFLLEEQVLAGGLKPYHHLYIPGLRYQRASVHKAVQTWRREGGKLLLDNEANPAFEADEVAPLIIPVPKGMGYAVNAVACTNWVRAFQPTVQPYARVEEGRAIVRTKELPGVRFVVAVNDLWEAAEFGAKTSGTEGGSDIVDIDRELKEQGRMRQVSAPLEDIGVAQTITLSLAEASADAAFYDLRAGRRLTPSTGAEGRVNLRLDVAPGDAVIVAVYARPPAGLRLEGPKKLQPGHAYDLAVTLLDARGKPLQGRQGVNLEVLDPKGQRTDASGLYRLMDGRTTVRLRLPLDAPTGIWRVLAKELASSLKGESTFDVTGE